MTVTAATGTPARPAVFYSLPAHRLAEGMSTADGQDITDVWYDAERGIVGYDTYTPSGDPDEDAYNQAATDDRVAGWDDLVDLAVFGNTEVDGRPGACPVEDCPSPWCAAVLARPAEITAILNEIREKYARAGRGDDDIFRVIENRLSPLAPGELVQFQGLRGVSETRWLRGTVIGPWEAGPQDQYRQGDLWVLALASGRRAPVFLSSVRRPGHI